MYNSLYAVHSSLEQNTDYVQFDHTHTHTHTHTEGERETQSFTVQHNYHMNRQKTGTDDCHLSKRILAKQVS